MVMRLSHMFDVKNSTCLFSHEAVLSTPAQSLEAYP